MKATGLTRKIDKSGRLVLPKKIRTSYGLYKGVFVEMYVDEEKIVIKRYK